MKKLLAILMTLLLLASFSTSALAQGDSTEPQLIVSTEKAMPGDEVAVTISIQNNPGIGVINPKFVFDSSRLEWLGYEEGGLTGWTVTSKAAVWLGYEDSHFDGVILTLKFKVMDSAPEGLAEIRLICGDGDAYNFAEQLVLFQLVSGGVQIGAETHEHSPAPETRENEHAPSCTEPGSYDTVVTCLECGAEISRVTVPVPATGHQYDAPRFQWSEDHGSADAIFICSQRDDVQAVEALVSREMITEAGSNTTTEKLTATASFQGMQYSETKVFSSKGEEISSTQSAEPLPSAEPSPSPEAEAAPASSAPAPEASAAPAEKAAEAQAPTQESAADCSFPVLPVILICCAIAVVLFLLFRKSRNGKSA